ncbi:MAG: ParB/RepB/Spo0J family partition protein [Gammaproteobacteria bacterium]|nr:ParB/RepB/Spo0J family partition protein [Gammaproteobacteria bacterium]
MKKKSPILQHISIEQLIRGQYQPRRHFDATQLQELADSIKATGGLLQPIIVRPMPSSDQYEIIAGERRWRAAQLAELSEVSCLVSEYTDEQALQAAIIENTSRTDLNPIEEAAAYQRLIDEFQYMHEEVAAAVGKSRVAITNALRLLRLDARVQAWLISNDLSEGHGKILAGLSERDQYHFAKEAVAKKWSVRRLESAIKKHLQGNQQQGVYSDSNLKKLETALTDHLGNQVNIDYEDRGGGYVKIRFNNIDELEGHFGRFGFQFEKDS